MHPHKYSIGLPCPPLQQDTIYLWRRRNRHATPYKGAFIYDNDGNSIVVNGWLSERWRSFQNIILQPYSAICCY